MPSLVDGADGASFPRQGPVAVPAMRWVDRGKPRLATQVSADRQNCALHRRASSSEFQR